MGLPAADLLDSNTRLAAPRELEMTDDAFDNIVTGFYRAAGGAIGWIEALVPFQRAMSAIAIYLHAVDPMQGRVVFAYAANDMPVESELDYLRTYHQIDPRANLVIGLEPGKWINCWEVFDDAFVARDPFYQEFLIPYGGRYVSGVKLLQDDSMSVLLGVHRGNGSPRLDLAEILVCQRLAHHLTGALQMHRSQLRLRQENRLGLELLTRLRAPIVLIDDQRQIQQANPAARALLANGGPVFESHGRLCCRRPGDDSALLLSLRKLLWTGVDSSTDIRSDTLHLHARSASSDDGVGLYLDALRPKKTLHVFGERPLAMVMIHDPRKHLTLDPFVVATAFSLTPAEARVAVAAVEGASAEQIATRYGTSIHTVRSQLQAILQKTGTTRQTEMIGLLAGLPMATFRSGGC